MADSPVAVNVLIVLAFLLALFFPLAYRRSKWKKYLPGRALMTFSVVVTLVMGLGTWRVFTGNFAPWWLRITSYVLIVGALLLMDVVLLREQSHDRKEVRREAWKVDQHG